MEQYLDNRELLMEYIYSDDTKSLKHLITSTNVPTDEATFDAIRMNRIASLETLLILGCKINVSPSALHWAIRYQNIGILNWLSKNSDTYGYDNLDLDGIKKLALEFNSIKVIEWVNTFTYY